MKLNLTINNKVLEMAAHPLDSLALASQRCSFIRTRKGIEAFGSKI